MSPLPISRSALDRLGERLAASDTVSDADESLFETVLVAYQAALAETRHRLVALGYTPSTRTKTRPVLLAKLRREPRLRLKDVQDLAGARVTVRGTRLDQDAVVRRVVAEFADGARPPRVKDRRDEPSSGYRAVHIVVTVDGVPVEVQVRTAHQDRWAQITERLGDAWGRDLRYGGAPERPEALAFGRHGPTREQVWVRVQALSALVDALERITASHAAEPVAEPVRIPSLRPPLDRMEGALEQYQTRFLRLAETVL